MIFAGLLQLIGAAVSCFLAFALCMIGAVCAASMVTDKPHAEPVRRSDLLERLRKHQEN